MTNIPSVSVIVPMYKVERYIKSCVDSILAQTFQDFEIILVDDASPDNCAELCQKFYGDNEKVRLVRHEKNLGLGPARNTGMKHAVGKYIYFVDSDDLILPAALEKLFNVAERTNAQVVRTAGWYKLKQEEAKPVHAKDLKLTWARYNNEGFLPNNLIYRFEQLWKKIELNPSAWCGFYRRDFLETNQIQFISIICEDVPFHLIVLGLAERFYILHDAVYIYRIRENSIMTAKDVGKLSRAIHAMVVGSIFTAKFLNRLPDTEKSKIWRDSLLMAFFDSFFIKQITLPFYKDLNLTTEMNETVNKALVQFFGDGAPFVRYFFNGYHLYRRQSEILLQQRNQIAAQAAALQQQNQRLNTTLSTFVREQDALSEIINVLKADGKRILLMGTPSHGNLGDQAIVLGELHVLKNYFPEYKVIEISYDYLTGERGEILFALGFEKFVRRDDVIFWPGGGNLGNLWIDEENLRRRMIEKFPHNKIVIFPQSICFTADDAGRQELARSQKIYNAHKNLHLMTRDEVSFAFAKKFFPAVKNYLLPDAVTVLQGIVDDVEIERKGVLFVLRRDKEKVRDDTAIKQIQNYLTAKNIPFEVTDTVIGEKVTAQIREQKVRDMLLKIRGSKLVVTDRFHGTIFSFVTRTPVLAFKSFDTKISAGIKWFKNFPSIFYAESQDLTRIENFIDKYYSDEKNLSAELNVNVNADKRFFDALNQIVGTKVVGKLPNRLIVDAVKVFERRITFDYRIQGDWLSCFNTDAPFFVEYSEDISQTPKDIAVIPFLCNVLPIAWVLDAEIVVPELDSDFCEHLAEIKRGYIEMYPRIKFGGKLTVGKLIKHNYEVGENSAVFFSGGADSFDTLIAHAEEHPTLITLLGADIKLTDRDGREIVIRHALETAKQFQCKSLFIASTFRGFLKEGALSKLVMPFANDGWWHGFQHGIGIISHAAPYAYLHKLKKIYMASSFSPEYKNYTCASDPTIDNYVHVGNCVTIHDGYEFNRQEKIRRICDFKRRTRIPIHLRVCWQSSGGENCCACEKCYRTICGILAEGENPAEFGFPSYTSTFEKMRRDFQSPDFKYRQLTWKIIQARFRERSDLPAELIWLNEMKF